MTNELPLIYIVDDDLNILKSTEMMLSSEHWEIMCLPRASQFLDAFVANRAGCLVLDVQLPDMSGLDLQKMLSDWAMDIPIVFITGEASVSNSVTALKSGAADFIQKPYSGATLVTAIKNALNAQDSARRQNKMLKTAHERFAELSDREWQVLICMVSGPIILSSKEVARELDISHRTVEHHRARIMDKSGSRSLLELIRLASFIGIANPDLGVTNSSLDVGSFG